ncbi:MAG: 4a-hydroxytetrahydrobiopterin dehydratase [Flavobacteriales bacterium]|nr:4a-hydroxytetrahydrobiopterin dehydratase [Flavobacteriales bacterium]
MSREIPSGWQRRDEGLVREFVFKDFKQAFGFMVQVALLSEQQGHHPYWNNVWNKVRIVLNTHDAGGRVTEKDYALAEAINTLL